MFGNINKIRDVRSQLFTPLSLFALSGLDSDFFVVLLQGSEILSGLRELTFLHAFSDVPVRRLSWRTSDRICGRSWRTPLRWQSSWRSCSRLSSPWPGHRRAPPWEAGS